MSFKVGLAEVSSVYFPSSLLLAHRAGRLITDRVHRTSARVLFGSQKGISFSSRYSSRRMTFVASGGAGNINHVYKRAFKIVPVICDMYEDGEEEKNTEKKESFLGSIQGTTAVPVFSSSKKDLLGDLLLARLGAKS